MAPFRMFLAWLLLAALPLQGFAAATMLYCGPAGGGHQPAALAAGAAEAHQSHRHQAAGEEHHHHDGAAAAHEHSSVDQAATPADGPALAGALPDSGHKCGVCASCCHGVALAPTPFLLSAAPAPQVVAQQAFLPLHGRPSPVPDKPPRA